MRWFCCALVSLALAACEDSGGDRAPDPGGADMVASADAGEPDPGAAADTPDASEPGPHPVGMEIPAFALEDINPTSATYGQIVSSADLAGKPYALIFLDSRCTECPVVADAMWAAYEAHPTWWDAQPTFAIERAKALARWPGTVTRVVENNSLPYLADTEELNLFLQMQALNHDFFAVTPDGKLDVWLPLYVWDEDEQVWLDHMTGRYGP